jgi:hypothetical protein
MQSKHDFIIRLHGTKCCNHLLTELIKGCEVYRQCHMHVVFHLRLRHSEQKDIFVRKRSIKSTKASNLPDSNSDDNDDNDNK